MRQYFAGRLILLTTIVISMCGGGSQPIVESTPKPEPGTAPEPPEPPSGSMDVPVPDAAWTPASIGCDKGRMLIQALRDQRNIALLLPEASDIRGLENRIYQMVKAASPETNVVARNEVMLDHLLEERGEIPYRVSVEHAGHDVFGRPYFLPKEHPLNTDWLSRREALSGADAVLVVRPIKIGDVQLKEMRRRYIGGCENFEKSLQAGLDAAGGYFSSYETEASEILGKEFHRHLSSAMPFWKEELAQFAATASPGSTESRCADAYKKFLGKYDACLQGTCSLSPRVFAKAGGVVGMLDEDDLIPDTCPTSGMRDFSAEIKDLGDRALCEVLPSLEGEWTGEMVRKGALERFRSGMADVCAPRHRRIREDQLDSMRGAVGEYLEMLKSEQFLSKWERMRGIERIPGVGPVQVLARVRPQTVDPAAGASGLLRQIRDLDRCRQGNERLLQAALIDVGTSEVLFMNIFFEESLLCEDLPPR